MGTCARLGAVALVVAAVALAAVPAAPAAPLQRADPAVQELGLEVVAAHGGPRAGGWVPVEVVVEPARLLEADLVVSTRSLSGAVSEVRPIEAAARTRRVYRFVLPDGPVRVRVEEAGREAVEVRAGEERARRAFAVGHLGEALPAGLPGVRSEPTGWTGTWVAVDPAWLEVSPAALSSLSTLVAPAAALADLSGEARAALRTAVVEGLDLVMAADADGGLPDIGLPLPATAVVPAAEAPGGRGLAVAGEVWALPAAALAEGGAVDGQPAGGPPLAARLRAGRGTVAAVPALPGSGPLGASADLWSVLAEPSAAAALPAPDWSPASVAFQLQRVFTSDDRPAPALPWLALFTAAYVLVVGPVNGFVLGRLGRRELAWATVPIVTVVFTAAAFMGVSAGRPAQGFAARALVSLDGVASELVAAGVRAPTEGQRTIELAGDGWTARPLLDGGRPAVLRHGGGVRAELDLAGLQFGGLVARRSTQVRPPLAVEAEAHAEWVLARVRNTGAAPVEGIVVRVATATRSVGTLAPGEEREVEIAATTLPQQPPYQDPFEGLPSRGAGGMEALLREHLLDGSPGTAWAVGISGQGRADVRVDGAAAEDRGLLVAAGATVRDAGAGSPFATSREAFAVQGRPARTSPLAFDGLEQAVLRFQLPAGAAGRPLRARIDTVQPGLRQAAEVWVPRERRWLPLQEAFGPEGGDPAALLDPLGAAWVRIEGDLAPFNYSSAALDGLLEAGG